MVEHVQGEKWYDYQLGSEKLNDSKLKTESSSPERSEELAGLYLKIDTELFETSKGFEWGLY